MAYSTDTLLKKGVTHCEPFDKESTKACAMDSKGPNEKPMGIVKKKVDGANRPGKFRFR